MGLAFFVMFGSMLYRKEISAILNVVLDPLTSLAMAEDYLRKRLNQDLQSKLSTIKRAAEKIWKSPQDCAFYQTWN